jgi:hypothetical protein
VPRHHLDSHLVDAILRLVGGVFFTTCDIAGPQAAAVAVERLRSFGDVNSDNRDCHALCHALADMQEDALHAKDYDFRQSMKTAN